MLYTRANMNLFTQKILFFWKLLFVFIVLGLISKGHGDQTVFYDEPNYEGSTFTLNMTGGCYNLKRKWIDRISSAQVEADSCMIAWKNGNCNGQSVKLLPSSSQTKNLENGAFSKKIKSISLCTEISSRPTTGVGDRMWNPTKTSAGVDQSNSDAKVRQRVELNFYDEPNFKGSSLTLTSSGDCYIFKARWMNRVSSLDSGGKCLNIWDTPNCEGVPATLCADSEAYSRNLDMIGYDKRIQSVRLCTKPFTAANYDERPSVIGDNSDGLDEFRNNRRKNDESFEIPEPQVDNATGEDVIKTALFEHNRLRQMHGVPDLKWDFKLQHIAQTHAEWLVRNNKFEHSSSDELGENIGGITTTGKLAAVKEAIHLWYNEIKNYNFDNPRFSVLEIKAGHFTQLVWKSTTHIGLGIAWNPSRQWYVVVCNYSPPGNYKGLYEKNVFRPFQT